MVYKQHDTGYIIVIAWQVVPWGSTHGISWDLRSGHIWTDGRIQSCGSNDWPKPLEFSTAKIGEDRLKQPPIRMDGIRMNQVWSWPVSRWFPGCLSFDTLSKAGRGVRRILLLSKQDFFITSIISAGSLKHKLWYIEYMDYRHVPHLFTLRFGVHPSLTHTEVSYLNILAYFYNIDLSNYSHQHTSHGLPAKPPTTHQQTTNRPAFVGFKSQR